MPPWEELFQTQEVGGGHDLREFSGLVRKGYIVFVHFRTVSCMWEQHVVLSSKLGVSSRCTIKVWCRMCLATAPQVQWWRWQWWLCTGAGLYPGLLASHNLSPRRTDCKQAWLNATPMGVRRHLCYTQYLHAVFTLLWMHPSLSIAISNASEDSTHATLSNGSS